MKTIYRIAENQNIQLICDFEECAIFKYAQLLNQKYYKEIKENILKYYRMIDTRYTKNIYKETKE